jgi:hypothetical protein
MRRTLSRAATAALATVLVSAMPCPAEIGPPAIRPALTEGPAPSAEGAGAPVSEDREIPARVVLGPGGRDLRLSGDIMEGVAARVSALLAANPGIEHIHLTSDGGLVDEATSIAEAVAARGLSTYVPDVCASACTLIFVRGRNRYLVEGGRLGFHAPYDAEEGGRISPVDPAPERAAYRAAGLAEAFVSRALAVPSSEIWAPEPALLREAGVVTDIVGTDRFPDSSLDADASPAAARATVLRAVPLLSEVEPERLSEIVAWYREGYEAGRTEAEAIAGLRRFATGSGPDRLRAAQASGDAGR